MSGSHDPGSQVSRLMVPSLSVPGSYGPRSQVSGLRVPGPGSQVLILDYAVTGVSKTRILHQELSDLN